MSCLSKRVKSRSPDSFRKSSVWKELYTVRNAKPYLSRFGTLLGSFFAALELWATKLGLKAPWSLKHLRPDYQSLKPAIQMEKIQYPKPDGVVSFDRLSSLALSNIAHDHDQPCHLRLKNSMTPVDFNLKVFDGPEQRYCPAGVYEFVNVDQTTRLQINAQNCIHCKTCDIKDPSQNIVWIPPEGGSGPIYIQM